MGLTLTALGFGLGFGPHLDRGEACEDEDASQQDGAGDAVVQASVDELGRHLGRGEE